jgi:hypothetical protein
MLWTATCTLLLALYEADKVSSNYEFPRLTISTMGAINTFSDVLFMILLGLGLMIARMKLQKNQKMALLTIFGYRRIVRHIHILLLYTVLISE